jgi:hypothetical protein
MKKYSSSVSTQPRLDYGIDLIEGLKAFRETQVLAGPLEVVNRDLQAIYQTRQAKREPLIRARAVLRVREYFTDQLIRRFARAVEIADGGRRGPLFAELFPEGVTPVVSPVGTRQVDPTQALLGRLSSSKQSGVEALREKWLAPLQDGVARLQEAAQTHATTAAEYRTALQQELALRQEHARVVDRLVGQVRGTYPQNRAAQDAVFPTNASRRAVDRDGDDVLADAIAGVAAQQPATTQAPQG